MDAAIPALTMAANWPFGEEIRKCLIKNDYTPNQAGQYSTPAKADKMASCVAGRASLENLGQTRCAVCHGFGHSKKVCPTAPRLTILMSFSAVTKNCLAQARATMAIEKAHHLEPDAPIPKCSIPMKRPRTHSNGTSLAYTSLSNSLN